MRKTAWIWFLGFAAWLADAMLSLRMHNVLHARRPHGRRRLLHRRPLLPPPDVRPNTCHSERSEEHLFCAAVVLQCFAFCFVVAFAFAFGLSVGL